MTPPTGDCLVVVVGLISSDDPADSAFLGTVPGHNSVPGNVTMCLTTMMQVRVLLVHIGTWT